MSTIFAKIIAGELPCFKVYEDDHVLAFLDINPIQPGHTLVVSKVASPDALACDPTDLSHIMIAGQKIARAIKLTVGAQGINFIFNNGAAAGQLVFHTHLHIIPRFMDDGVYQEPLPGEYEDGEAESLAVAITTLLT